jgi:inositol oxygenase
MKNATAENPLQALDQWDDYVASRYQEGRPAEQFRNYDVNINPGVAEFYRQNHAYQTFDTVRAKEEQYLPLRKGKKSIWEAAEFLNTLVDDSDPDTDLSQIDHLLQTSEAIRRDGHPRWFVLTGFLHDLGKVLCLYGEPQWAVVGDTFPVGCAYSDQIVFPEYFAANPDSTRSIRISTACMSPIAGWTKSICPGDTMSTFITWLKIICRSPRTTCCAITLFTQPINTERIAI